MNYKYIIGSGCSFASLNWLSSLHDNLSIGAKQILLSYPGGGNTIIVYGVLKELNRLLESGVDPKSIFILNMLSDFNRMDMIINKEDIIEYDLIVESSYENGGSDRLMNLADDGSFYTLTEGQIKSGDYSNEAFLKTGGLNGPTGSNNYLKFIQDWYKRYYSKELLFVNTLREILTLQNFCNINKINCFFTVWQNIFHYRGKGELEQCISNTIHFKSKNKKLFKDVYSIPKIYWDMIDFDKFIFYENSEVKMGGIAEFSICNGIPLGWDNDKYDNSHPNSDANKLYGEFLSTQIKGVYE